MAIKIIQLDEFAPDSMKNCVKVKREAQALAKLSHPNIGAIIDYGNVEGILYLVMPLLEGGTLVRFSNRKLPYADAPVYWRQSPGLWISPTVTTSCTAM